MRRRNLMLLAGSGLLAACSQAGPLPSLTYRDRPPVMLPVSFVDAEDGRQPLASANFIDVRRGNELARAAQAYLRARFVGGGGVGSAVAIIQEASIIERLITGRSGGLVGVITGEPTYGLDGTLTVRVVERDTAGNELGYARASVARSRSVRAGTTVVERDAEAEALVNELINQIDPVLVQAVIDNLHGSGSGGA